MPPARNGPPSNRLGHVGESHIRPLLVYMKASEGKNSRAHSSAVNFVLCEEQEGGKSCPFPAVPPPWEKAQDRGKGSERGERLSTQPVLGLLIPTGTCPSAASPDADSALVRAAPPRL